MENARYSDLVGFSQLWEASGLKRSSVAPLTAALLRSEAIGREAVEAERGARKVARIVGEEVAAGTCSLQEGLEEVARRALYAAQVSKSQRTELGPIVRDEARGACHRSAREFLTANADALAREARGSTGQEAIAAWLATFAGLERVGAPA